MKSLTQRAEEAGFTADMLTGQDSILTEVLQYHYVPGVALKAGQMKNGQKLKTSQGETLTVNVGKDGIVTLVGGDATNVASVVQSNTVAGKGVMHIISNVLLPKDYATLLPGTSGEATLSQLASLDGSKVPSTDTGAPAPPAKAPTPKTTTTIPSSPPPVTASPAPPPSNTASRSTVGAAIAALPLLLALL